METASPARLFERCLEYTAEHVGDFHRPLLDRFYQELPEAKAQFARHANANNKLEDDMIEQALYCLMTWYERPAEIQIVLRDTVPHHIETLDIPMVYFEGLISTLLDIITEATPAEAEQEHQVLLKLREEINETLIDASS